MDGLGEDIASVPDNWREGDGTMHAAIAVPGSASTILTHVFGRGLADERYVVERFRAMADGDIRRAPGDAAPAKGRRKAKRTIASLKAVQQLRPTHTEITSSARVSGSKPEHFWESLITY